MLKNRKRDGDLLGLLNLAESLDQGEPPPWLVSEFIGAARHVARGRTIIAGQRSRIEQLAARGRSTKRSQQMLETFLRTQRCLEDHERQLREAVDGKAPTFHPTYLPLGRKNLPLHVFAR